MIEPWIAFTLSAAFVQTFRFMAQRHLKVTTLSSGGATLARFLYSAPLVAVLVTLYAHRTGQALALPGPRFWAFALAGGLAQILATMCMVSLFQMRNFAVGVTFKKTEVVLTALVSALVLGEGVSRGGALAIGLGFLGVVLLSHRPGAAGRGRFLNRAAGLGLLSGAFFSVSAVGYRGASLEIASSDPLLRAGVTLACVTACQMLGLMAWLAWREAGQVTAVLRAWRVAALVGLTSMLGSFCWFTAFTLENAAYVNAVGQAEVVFSLAGSALVLRERMTGREAGGIALLTLSILALILLA